MNSNSHAKGSAIAIASLSILLFAMTTIAIVLAYFITSSVTYAPIYISVANNQLCTTSIEIDPQNKRFTQQINIVSNSTDNVFLRAKISIKDKTNHKTNLSNLCINNWTCHEDYYYYNNTIKNGQSINLLSNVVIPESISDESLLLIIEIDSVDTTQLTNWTNIPNALKNIIMQT